jgi:hypothetical protein
MARRRQIEWFDFMKHPWTAKDTTLWTIINWFFKQWNFLSTEVLLFYEPTQQLKNLQMQSRGFWINKLSGCLQSIQFRSYLWSTWSILGSTEVSLHQDITLKLKTSKACL